MNFQDFLITLSKIKNLPLPAEASQIKMSPAFRIEQLKKYKKDMKTAKQSAVLALFYPDHGMQTKFALILRKAYNGVHSSQVSFPGGKVEAGDIDLEFTAKRETHEEIGVSPTEVNVIKELTRVYIPPSNFTVQPFLGFSENKPNFVLQEDEVADLIEVSLMDLFKPENVVSETVSTSYNYNVQVPAFLLNGHIVWGATAMMLSEVKDLLKAALY